MRKTNLVSLFIIFCFKGFIAPVIYVNQFGFDTNSPTIAIIGVDHNFDENTLFILWHRTEQWIPHAAWFLQTVTAIAE